MASIYAQVILKLASAIPADYSTNTFSFEMTNSGTNIDAVTLNLKDFYSSLVSTFLPATVSQNGHIVKWYLHGGPPPNYPQAETGFNLATAPSGTGLPSEVAVALSFQGDRIPGQEQRRRMGRVFIGPLRESTSTSARPAAAAKTALANAGEQLMTDVLADSDGYWAVYSKVNGSSTEVTNGWVDDAFDIQRRRGLAVTSKLLWP
uniref:Uncharacterized protein n=1 Tax=uncultured prokaryote TaxID=198431 RepID=A0A0H5Q5Y4_9ZZZZ|nr:hypothetical protein [uncultured prokaryote]